MVKLKKYTLNRIPKFVVYSLTNTYLSEHVKHIKVYNYSQDRAFREMANTFFVPIRFNLPAENINKLHGLSLPLNSLIFLASVHKDKAKFLKFADKMYAESIQLEAYLEVSPKYLTISPDFIWDVRMILMDTWNYD